MFIQTKRTLTLALTVCVVMAGAAPRSALATDLPFVRGHEEPQDDDQQDDQQEHQQDDEQQDQGQGQGQDGDQQDDQQGGGQENGQDDGQGQGDDGQQGNHHQKGDKYRVDCRYHNDEGIEGVGHCYASAIYGVSKGKFKAVKFGVGCDALTIYNDAGRVHEEELGERISPKTAAFPAIEIQPKGALTSYGTYESVLDIRQGRLAGRCYVHRLGDDRFLPFD